MPKTKLVKYESDYILPKEINEMINKLHDKLLSTYERDKILCIISGFRYDILRWFANNTIKNDSLQ